MKRGIGLAFLGICVLVGFLTIRGAMPFMPIFGSSMEPTLHSGALMMIQPVEPQDVKVGDIIVYNVPKSVADYYNYPPVVSHRVIEVKIVPSLGFRTKGDNTGEDPFTVRAQDIRGTVGDQIPYLGLPLLFFQSQQGMIFVIIALALLALFLYGGELGRGTGLVHRGIFAPVINEEKRSNRMLTRKIEVTEKKMDSTELALEKFAVAIADYAQHLASHTSAVKSLAEASQELKKGAAEQNLVLSTLVDSIIKAQPRQETTVSQFVPPVPENIVRTFVVKPVVEKPQPRIEKPAETPVKFNHPAPNKAAVSGCARKKQLTAEEIQMAKKEILRALENRRNRPEQPDKNQL